MCSLCLFAIVASWLAPLLASFALCFPRAALLSLGSVRDSDFIQHPILFDLSLRESDLEFKVERAHQVQHQWFRES